MISMRGLMCYIILIFLRSITYAIPPEEMWVARYNSVTNNGDYARKIAVDPWGNVFVAGQSFRSGQRWNYVTIKYDPDGNILWEADYNGPADDDDYAQDIVVDDFGYAYITGTSLGNETSTDYATIKYDPNGNECWAVRYDSPAEYDPYNDKWWAVSDEAQNLMLDGLGNIYVTGLSGTVKYDSNGNELWVARYDRLLPYAREVYSLAVDNVGNAYVTGKSCDDEWDENCMIIKYDPNGNELWVVRPDYPNVRFMEGRAIIVDDLDNIYVTILCVDLQAGYNLNYATAKYDPDGNEIWMSFYDSLSDSGMPHNLVIDSCRNIYVTGIGGNYDEASNYSTVKYDPNGNEIWAREYDAGSTETNKRIEHPSAIVIDIYDRIYITGWSSPQNSPDNYLTVCYNSNGELQWSKEYSRSRDFAYDCAVDNKGNVYVTGSSGPTVPYEDIITIKYTQHNYCVEAIEGDMNGDCQIDFFDFVVVAHDWLETYDYIDIDTLSENWLECNNALEADCWQ